MKSLTSLNYLLLLLLFLYSSVYAQLSEIQFEYITAADGLVDDDFIFEIYQDRQGFMWFATFDGLSKYDGYKFTNYRHNPIDSSSISSSSIYSIYENPNSGQFWFGTSGGGLNLFNPATEKFKRYQHDPNDSTSVANNYVRDIIPAGEIGLWIATQDGLDYFDFKTEVFTHFRHDPLDSLSLSSNEIWKLYIDKDKTLWVGTGSFFLGQNNPGGLNRYNPETKTFKRYNHLSDDDSSMSADNICVINEDQNGTLYVGTGKATLHRYDREKHRFERLSKLSKQQPYAAYGEGFAGIQPGVWSFIQDINGYYWVASFSGGLNRFDLKNDFMKHYPGDKDDVLALTSKNILALYEDLQGSIWFSSYKNGIHKIIPSRNRFHPFAQKSTLPNLINDKDVRAIFEDSFGTFWIGTSVNILRFDPALDAVKNYNEILNFDVRWIDVIHEDASKRLWIGGAAISLTRFDLKSGDVKRYLPDEQDKNSFPFWNVMTISQENDSILWLGSEFEGLAHFNINSEKYKHYTYDPSDTLSISSDKVWITLVDQKNILWIGTNNGLNRLNKKTDALERFLPGVEVHIILEDSNNNFWLGTIGNGLILFDRETGRSISYTTDDGLLSNVIYSLAEDDQGFIWLGSAGGLTRLDTKKMSFVSFDKQDGLLNHFTKYSDAVLKTKNGELLFGGNKGITAFAPDQFKINNLPPYLAITGLSIFNEPYKEKGILDSPITLDYNQNDLTFEYVGLHFKNPSKNKYMVKLEPYEKEWRVVNTVRSAHYTNLAPGNYSFHVKASNSDGVWNEEGASITIIITLPWWKTWWAYTMYGLCAFSLLYGLRRYETNRLNWKNQSRVDEVKLKERAETDRMKSRFFANISHEFRTPLTLILGPIQKWRTNTPDPKLRDELGMVERNAQRLLRLINQLLDLSKLEAGGLKLVATQCNIVPLVKGIAQSFQSSGEERGVALQVESVQDEIVMYVDRDKMEKILVNLLSNAFKFTSEGGTVTVDISIPPAQASSPLSLTTMANTRHPEPSRRGSKGFVAISVRDTGIGISEEELPHIFDRFYQVDATETREQEGTGIGLAHTKELVELHHGIISVKSEVGKGTEFVVHLPLAKEHFKPEEIVEVSTWAEPLSEPTRESIYNGINSVSEETTGDSAEEPSVERPLILIIEDSTDMRAYIREYLITEYRVEEAKNGIDGVEKAKESIPDLIISDVMMPKMDGFEVCRQLKHDEKTRHVPVILLTAKAGQENKLEGFETGADDYLVKPFDSKELIVRVKNLIELRRTLRERFSVGQVLKPGEIAVTSIDDAFLQKVIKAIEAKIGDEKFSVEDLAREVSMSRSQLHRKLTALTNQSPSYLLRYMRLHRAKQLLEQNAGTVSEIAFQVGFGTVAHFTKTFHEQFGVVPSAVPAESREMEDKS